MDRKGETHGVNLSSLLTTGKYSDLRIVCDECQFQVHKAVVCPQSVVISAACDGRFQVGAVSYDFEMYAEF